MSGRKFASTSIRDSEDTLGLTPEDVNKLLAKADKSAAITDKLGTIVEGGLVSTITIYLRDLASMVETAGLSGLKGALEDNPAFWAGGSHADALAVTSFLRKIANNETPDVGEYAALAKIALLHSGAAKVGHLIVEESGRVTMVDPLTGKERLVFSAENIPTIDELLGSTIWKGAISISQATVWDIDVVLAQNLIVEKDNSEINFSANSLEVSASALMHGEGMIPSADIRVKLLRDNVTFVTLAQVYAVPPWGETVSESLLNINRTIKGCAAGTYKIVLSISRTKGIIDSFGSISSSNFKWEFKKEGVRHFQFGLNGMMAFFKDNHIHFSEEKGWDVRGKTNMPGVLAKGRISEGGVRDVTKAWGDKYSTGSISKPSGVGSYSVPVNCKNGDYDVDISPRTANRTFQVGVTTATYFDVFFRDHNGNAANSEFSYTLVGNNY